MPLLSALRDRAAAWLLPLARRLAPPAAPVPVPVRVERRRPMR